MYIYIKYDKYKINFVLARVLFYIYIIIKYMLKQNIFHIYQEISL